MSEPDIRRWITEEPLDLSALLDETEDESTGGLVVFGGTVRCTNEGRPVTGMTYDAHVPMAARVLRELEAEVVRDYEVRQCRIVHRIGPMDLGVHCVYVVVRAPHRAAAFRAAEYAIDTLKDRTPIWKEEHYVDGDSRHLDGVPLKTP